MKIGISVLFLALMAYATFKVATPQSDKSPIEPLDSTIDFSTDGINYSFPKFVKNYKLGPICIMQDGVFVLLYEAKENSIVHFVQNGKLLGEWNKEFRGERHDENSGSLSFEDGWVVEYGFDSDSQVVLKE